MEESKEPTPDHNDDPKKDQASNAGDAQTPKQEEPAAENPTTDPAPEAAAAPTEAAPESKEEPAPAAPEPAAKEEPAPATPPAEEPPAAEPTPAPAAPAPPAEPVAASEPAPAAPEPPVTEERGTAESLSPGVFADVSSLGTWMMIMAVLTFANVAFTVVGTLVAISTLQVFQTLGNLIGIGISVVLAIFMLKSSKAYKEYSNTHNPSHLEDALGNMKNYFMTMGIYIIVVFGLAILGGVIGGVAAASSF